MAMGIRFGMVVLVVRDLRRSIEFYRLLGLNISEPMTGRPVSVSEMNDGINLVLLTDELARRDPDWSWPEGGYQQMLEFMVGSDAAVDAEWEKLTAAGHHGRQAPAKVFGPYAAIVDDPDGNVVLITSDPGPDPGAAASA
jgi:predicted lactoylglutathione lyase